MFAVGVRRCIFLHFYVPRVIRKRLLPVRYSYFCRNGRNSLTSIMLLRSQRADKRLRVVNASLYFNLHGIVHCGSLSKTRQLRKREGACWRLFESCAAVARLFPVATKPFLVSDWIQDRFDASRTCVFGKSCMTLVACLKAYKKGVSAKKMVFSLP